MNGTRTPSYKTTVLIWGAMVVSIAMYIVVVEVLNIQDRTSESKAQMETVKLVLWCLSASYLFVIPFIRKVMLKPLENQMTPEPVYSPVKLQSFYVIACAIAESVCLYGFAYYFITGSKMDFYIFTGISLCYFAWLFPRKSQWPEVNN